MSDEELVQCPKNPNHLVPRSQIDEHVNTCKLLMDLNQEMQMTSSDEEIRSLTSYQWSLQEGSSHQGGSQMETLPFSEGTSSQEWRSQLKPGMQVTSPNRFQMQKPYARPFQSSETSSETDVDLSGSECSSDNQSRLQMTDARTKKYIKLINTRSKSLKKLTLDSHTDDTSSSSSDSTFSLYDTMPDKEKKIIQNLGEEYIKQTSPAPQEESSSQQATSSQQAASSPQETILQPAKLTLKKEDEKMEVKSMMSLSSSSLPQVSTSLEVPMDESSLSEDVSQEKSESISSYDETTDDSDDTQWPRRKRKIKHKVMDTEVTTEEETSRLSTDVSISLEVYTEEYSMSEEDLQEKSRPFCIPGQSKYYSEVSQQLGRKRKMEHEEMDTEEIVAVKVSHLLAEVTTPLEVELEESSSSEEVPLQQSQPFSFHAASTSDSDVSQQPKMISKKKRKEMDTEENIVAEALHTLSEVVTQSEVGLAEPSSSVPKEQSKPVSSPARKTQESVGSDRQSRSRKKKHEELMETDSVRPRHRSKSFKQRYSRMNIKEKKETEKSHLSSEEPSPLEVETEEPSLSGDLSKEQSQPASSSTETRQDLDDSERQICSRKEKYAEITIEETVQAEESHILAEETTLPVVETEEPSLSRDVPQQQLPSVSSPAETKHELDFPQKASRSRKRSYARTDIETGNLQEAGNSQQSDSSQEADSSQRKGIKKKKRSDSYLTTDEDKSQKIGLEEPSSFVRKEQSKPVVSCGKTKHESDVPQSSASSLRKRSYEATESKVDSLEDSGVSYQTHSSQEEDS